MWWEYEYVKYSENKSVYRGNINQNRTRVIQGRKYYSFRTVTLPICLCFLLIDWVFLVDWCKLFLLWQQELSALFHFFFLSTKNEHHRNWGKLAACPCRHIKSTLNKLIVCHAALKLNSYSPSLTFCPLSSSLEICSVSEGDSTPRKLMMH